jgi:hypothetical protein
MSTGSLSGSSSVAMLAPPSQRGAAIGPDNAFGVLDFNESSKVQKPLAL